MYGSAEEVLGYALDRLGRPQPSLFSATKVWTPFASRGEWQIEESHKLWGLQQFDLYQIHNLVAWEHHLQTLQQHKHEGTIRYIGVTTSHGRRHQELEQIIQTQPIDFVQLTYNILDREVERRLLPAAIEKGVAVIANRPFQGGDLFFKLARKPLPKWAGDIDCQNWAGFFLKFVVSHHAITCAIPATSQVEHMIENMGALRGKLPDSKTRKRMADYVASL
jgi:diketogulonate reductase-like aldo/keto reductase